MPAARWPIQEADLEELMLDPRNVRVRAGWGEGLSEADRAAAETAIVKYMVEAEEVLDLMHSILRDGYLDNEIPVVVAESGTLMVLEGNRRLTALKLVARPELLGSGATRVRRLISRYADHGTPTRIRVMVAPSRAAAQPLLARLHTGESKKPWIREQQSIFFHAQLDKRTTVDDLRVEFPGQASKMTRFIAMGEMRELIRGMKYDNADLKQYVLNSELKMTAFEYAYRPKTLRAALGLQFDRDGLLASKKLSVGQRRAITYILQRLRDRTLNTRSPELIAKYDEHEEFVELLRDMVAGQRRAPASDGENSRGAGHGEAGNRPGGSSNDQGTGTGKGPTGQGSPSGEGSRRRGPNRGDTKHRLDFDGFAYGGTSPGMRRRFEELRQLDVHQFPSATHDLLRTVLECSIKDYFRAQGEPLVPGTTLGRSIDALARKFSKDSKMTGHISAIKRKGEMTAEQFAGTADALNTTNHEPDQIVVGREVHEGWDRLKPILSQIVGTSPTATG